MFSSVNTHAVTAFDLITQAATMLHSYSGPIDIIVCSVVDRLSSCLTECVLCTTASGSLLKECSVLMNSFHLVLLQTVQYPNM